MRRKVKKVYKSKRIFIIMLSLLLIIHLIMGISLINMSRSKLRDQIEQRMLDVANTASYQLDGDEFAMILEGKDFDEREKLLGEFNKQIEGNLRNATVVVSCGMSLFEAGEDRDFSPVFERADVKMYERKRQLKKMK